MKKLYQFTILLILILQYQLFAQTFTAKTDFTTGTSPQQSIAIGDFNGDGLLDMAVPNFSSGTVSVFLNTTTPGASTPTFSAKEDFTTGSNPRYVSIGDFNGDGKLDMAVSNQGSSTVSVFLNNMAIGATTASFLAKTDFTTGTTPNAVAIGDFNGDGKLDMAVPNNGSNTVSVFLNNVVIGATEASFSAKADFTTGSSPISVAIGDLNGDGKLDMAVANNGGTYKVSVLLNNIVTGATTASFSTKTDFTAGSAPQSVSIGDFNGDGKLDMAVANSGSATVSVFLNDIVIGAATASFSTKTDFTTGTTPRTVTIGDLNGDGKPDMVITNGGSNTVSTYLNTTSPGATTPTFATKNDFTTGTNPIPVELGDFNGDGKLDMAVGNGNSNTISVFLNTTTIGTTTVSFSAKTDSTAGETAQSVALGDFNGDGKSDMVTANRVPNTVTVFLNTTTPGASTPTLSVKTNFTTGAAPVGVSIGDFNGDGKLDMVVANSGASFVSVFLNTTTPGANSPTFSVKTDFTTGSGPRSVSIGDFNGDGKLDMVVANSGASSVSVLLNTTTPGASTPTYSTKTDFTTGSSPFSVAIGDFNGDGKLDIAVANFGANSVSVFLNTTTPGASTPTFSAKTDFTSGTNPYAVAIGDFNGDGKSDITVPNNGSNTVSVFLNTTTPGASTPTFSAKTDFTTNTQPRAISVGDLNGDGKFDIAVANGPTNNVSIFLNTTTPGASTPTFSDKANFATDGGPISVKIDDLNGDGKPDITTANINIGTVSLLLNTTNFVASPTTQASNITASSIQTTQATINWTNGNGSARAVFILQGNTGTASPSDNTTYTANTVFGSGTQIDSTGWYCVYNGAGTSVAVTGLTAGTEYRVMVTEYNGSAGSEKYNANSGTNNPRNFSTTMTPPGNALNFDGTDDYVVTSSSSSLGLTNQVTMEAWLRTSYDNKFIVGVTGSDPNWGCEMAVQSEGYFIFSVYNGAWRNLSSNPITVNDNNWHHVTAVYDGVNLKLYIDGALVGTLNSPGSINTGNPYLTIGRHSAGILHFNGELDEVRIWNVARTQSQIQSNMNNVIDPTTSGLVAYYKFDLGTAGGTNTGITTLYDQTTNINDGTLNNFALSGSTSNWVESYAMVVPASAAATNLATTSITANWAAPSIGTVDKYFLDVSTSSDFSSFVTGYNGADVGNVLTKSVTGLTGNTTYYYRVRADKTSVTGEGGNSNVTSVTTAPAAPTLSSPSNNATGTSLSPTLSWLSVGGADKYRLEVNTASDFTGTVIYDQDTVSLASKQIGGLSDNKTYYWRVRAKNSAGNWGDVSSTFNFATGQTTLTSPSNNILSVSLTPTFTWPATTGASSYHLEVNTASNFSGTVKLDTTTAATSKTLNGTSLSNNTVYYWRVTANSNSLAKTNTSAVNSYTTKLAAPILSSPSDNATDVSLSPILSWSSVTGADKYRLEVNAASNFSGTVIYDQDTVSLPSKQIGGLSDNTKYYWRVTASNSSGNSSDVSSVSNFTTAQAATGQVSLISPPPSTIDASVSPTISWPVTSGATKYHLEVNTSSDFTGTVVIDANVTSTSLPVTGLNYNTTYYWRVTATSNSLSKTTTTVYSFTTKLAPPTLLSPADSSAGVSIEPVLVWSAMANVTRYNLLMSKNPYFTTIVLQKQLPDTSYHVDTSLDQNTQYYWKVSAVNSQGNAGEYTSPGSFTTGTTALPVELTNFSANVIEDKVQLSWSTATEVNNYGFEVQRSANSDQQSAESRFAGGEQNAGTWQRIGFVPGAGNSNSPKHYSLSDRPTEGTSFSYRLKQVDVNGDYKYYDPIAVTLTTKQTIVLMQNSPNPFNPSTVIKFYIPNNSDVSIKIYDMLGKEVTTLVNKQTEAGYHIVYWNGRDNYGNSAASGMYLYRLIAGNFVETKKMLLMK